MRLGSADWCGVNMWRGGLGGRGCRGMAGVLRCNAGRKRVHLE